VGQRSELDARIAFLEERLKTRPKGFLEQAELAGLYLQKGKLRRQTQHLEKAKGWAETSLAVYPNNLARVVLADLLQMEHKFEESLSLLGQVLAEEPVQAEARVLAVRALLAQGKAEQARQVLEPVAQAPIFAFRFLQAQVSEALGDVEKATQQYREALALENQAGSASESARLRAAWARLEIDRGNHKLADELLTAAKAIPVESPLVEMQRARTAAVRQGPKEAAAICREAFALYQDPLFLLQLADILKAEGKTAEAAQNYQAVVDLERDQPMGHERDVARALLELDAKAHRQEILDLMERDLARRRDKATLEVWAQVEQKLGPQPELPPFPSHNPIADAAAKRKASYPKNPNRSSVQ
jgi:tetratricopeptide (TPR) repeat protein